MQKIFLVVPAFLISITASSLQSVQGFPSSKLKGVEIYYYNSTYSRVQGKLARNCDGDVIEDWGNRTNYPDRYQLQCN